MSGTRGVVALGNIMARLADGPAPTAGELADATGLPRSSVFDVVRRLQNSGFVSRTTGGRLVPGGETVRLGLAAHGAQALSGPGEALLRLLRDQTDGTASLLADDLVLLRIAARWQIGDALPSFTAPIGTGLSVTLALRQNATRAARLSAETLFQQVVVSLKHYLDEAPV